MLTAEEREELSKYKKRHPKNLLGRVPPNQTVMRLVNDGYMREITRPEASSGEPICVGFEITDKGIKTLEE